MSKVLLVDDHPIVVTACRLLLEHDGVATVIDANDVVTGYQAFLQYEPDVIVVDLRLHGEDLGGLALIERIHSHAPHAAILVFSTHVDPQVIWAAIKAGATGYLAKDAPPNELAKAVEQVRAGQRYIDHRLAVSVALLREDNNVATLTHRERRALNLLANGNSYAVVAEQLGVSYKTVVTIAFTLRQKLSATGLPDLIRKAVELTRPKG